MKSKAAIIAKLQRGLFRDQAEYEAAKTAQLNASHPGAYWYFVTHRTHGRILVSVPKD